LDAVYEELDSFKSHSELMTTLGFQEYEEEENSLNTGPTCSKWEGVLGMGHKSVECCEKAKALLHYPSKGRSIIPTYKMDKHHPQSCVAVIGTLIAEYNRRDSTEADVADVLKQLLPRFSECFITPKKVSV
jgi:hypothetical protein